MTMTAEQTARPGAERRAGREAAHGPARRILRLEHAANIGPLVHVLLYLGLFAFALTSPWVWSPFLAVPLVVVVSLLNYSLSIGVLHMHTHRPLFVAARPNRLVDLACCIPMWLSAAEMRTVHVLNHHRYDDGPGDVTSTLTMEKGRRAIWYWLRYGSVVKGFTAKQIFAKDASRSSRKRRVPFVLDLAIVATGVTTLTVLFPLRMMVFYWLPFVVIQITSGYFAWLTHAPARGYDDASSSINTVGNILNFFIFNQGYHTVHHRYPGIHWTEIPDKLAYMRDVEPDVIVGYWVTLNSAWRIAAPRRFRDRAYGSRWQARLEARLEAGSVRNRWMPWFVWV